MDGCSGSSQGASDMNQWRDLLVEPTTSIREAMEVIDRTGAQIALVVDDRLRLLGTFSDGDARRALLRGLALTDPVAQGMHTTPTTVLETTSQGEVLAMMQRSGLQQLPITGSGGAVVGLALLRDYLQSKPRSNWIVVMAGGLGERLQELTKVTPKPMLKVGPRPLLETTVLNFAAQGFQRFYLAVNYKADQIQSYFGDGSQWGVEIRYLREDRRMGTAGALSLLPELPDEPVLVTNADLLIKENFSQMLEAHATFGAHATMGVRRYEMQVPFGVVQVQDGVIKHIHEKPVQSYMVSAGVNVLTTQVLQLVPHGQFMDMPTLLERAIEKKLTVRSHAINGYWLDIGRLPDFERANLDFDEVFFERSQP